MSKNKNIDYYLSLLTKAAPNGYALGLHIRFASALMMFQTYRMDWIEIYTQRGYMMCDPMISWGFAEEGAKRWSEIDMPDPHRI